MADTSLPKTPTRTHTTPARRLQLTTKIIHSQGDAGIEASGANLRVTHAPELPCE